MYTSDEVNLQHNIVSGNDFELSCWSLNIMAGITAMYGSIKLEKTTETEFTDPLPGLILYLPISGITEVSSPHYREKLLIEPGFAYLYATNGKPYNVRLSSIGSFTGLKLYFDSSISQYPAISALQSYQRYLSYDDFAMFMQQAITPDTLAKVLHLSEIFANPREHIAYIRSDIISLVDNQLAVFAKIEQRQQVEELKLIDAKTLAADNYLKRHLDCAPSVIALANIVGINHMTLKRAFHRLFDKTIYGRLRQHRMEQAYQLFNTGASVAETALSVGYQNPSKFTAKFTQHFGIRPSELLHSLDKAQL